MQANDQTRILAELTRLLAPAEAVENDETNILLREVLTRLEKLENQVITNPSLTVRPALLPHPSQQKFQIAEANEILLPQTNEKACRFEPDKPCDYCSMCSAQGF